MNDVAEGPPALSYLFYYIFIRPASRPKAAGIVWVIFTRVNDYVILILALNCMKLYDWQQDNHQKSVVHNINNVLCFDILYAHTRRSLDAASRSREITWTPAA